MDRRQPGFSLVEFMVVSALSAIVGAIAIPRVLGSPSNAQTSAVVADRVTAEMTDPAWRNSTVRDDHKFTDSPRCRCGAHVPADPRGSAPSRAPSGS